MRYVAAGSIGHELHAETGRGMAEAMLDHAGMLVGLDHERRRYVAEAMEGAPGVQASSIDRSSERAGSLRRSGEPFGPVKTNASDSRVASRARCAANSPSRSPVSIGCDERPCA